MSLGTNLGDKEKNLRDAVHKIEECSRMHRNGVAASGSAAEDAGDRA